VSSPDLEAQASRRIKDALNAAIQRTGKEEFAKISGTETSVLDGILQSEGEFVPVTIITLACQINRSHNDPDPAHSSISECLKGAILRLPQNIPSHETKEDNSSARRRRRSEFFKAKKGNSRISDPSTLRVVGYTANIVVFFVLGYFLGGVALGPLLGFPPCLGVTGTSPWVTPCTGSILGLILGAVFWLVYTYYYFVKKF
jgi:hypothetical protein